MRWPKEVELKEVGPRDGLQNEPGWVNTPEKVAWINMLSNTGIKEIEYSSFVHPKWIPALKDAREVGRQINRNPDVTYSALVPNQKGLEHALEAGIDRASVFMSASETHNLKNINKSIDETLPIMKQVIQDAKAADKKVTAYVSTVFDCPFEGKTDVNQVLRVAEALFEYGADDISLGDTIGSAVPNQIEEVLDVVNQYYANKDIIMHFHDTRGMAIANIVTSMNYGMTRFDTSIGGLGGCPYAPGAAGNVATNDVLYLMDNLGIETGIDEDELLKAAFYIQNKLGKSLPSRSLTYELSQMSEGIDADVLAQKHRRKRDMMYDFLKYQYDIFKKMAQ